MKKLPGFWHGSPRLLRYRHRCVALLYRSERTSKDACFQLLPTDRNCWNKIAGSRIDEVSVFWSFFKNMSRLHMGEQKGKSKRPQGYSWSKYPYRRKRPFSIYDYICPDNTQIGHSPRNDFLFAFNCIKSEWWPCDVERRENDKKWTCLCSPCERSNYHSKQSRTRSVSPTAYQNTHCEPVMISPQHSSRHVRPVSPHCGYNRLVPGFPETFFLSLSKHAKNAGCVSLFGNRYPSSPR
jgi:hypothetical protein